MIVVIHWLNQSAKDTIKIAAETARELLVVRKIIDKQRMQKNRPTLSYKPIE